MVQVLPHSRSNSRFLGSGEVPNEYSEFLDRFKRGNVLIAFGTTWPPTEKMIKVLVNSIAKMPEIGFIFAV